MRESTSSKGKGGDSVGERVAHGASRSQQQASVHEEASPNGEEEAPEHELLTLVHKQEKLVGGPEASADGRVTANE